MTNPPLVMAVVLAWNQVEITLECISTLIKSNYSNYHILLVDNGSTDHTSEVVPQTYPDVEILRIEVNQGLQHGYNAGIRRALELGAEYVMPMNNDTEVHPDMISHLVKAALENPRAGLLSPKIYNYYGNQKTIWCAGARWARFPPRVKLVGANAPDGPDYSEIMKMEYLTSCCLLIPSTAISKVGIFDEAYYFYYDDWDLSERYRMAGYDLIFVPDAWLWHKVSMSTLKTDKPQRWWYVMGKGTVRFYLRYKSPGILVCHVLWFILRESIKFKWSRIVPFVFGFSHGLADHWGWAR